MHHKTDCPVRLISGIYQCPCYPHGPSDSLYIIKNGSVIRIIMVNDYDCLIGFSGNFAPQIVADLITLDHALCVNTDTDSFFRLFLQSFQQSCCLFPYRKYRQLAGTADIL